ncbi:MAG TPA: ketoacyl-ACP synthase III, partial [Bryobacteraceae bacterium]|nr:ketoacyl-ACP synthase III [Bryobacteraceae bacterium]
MAALKAFGAYLPSRIVTNQDLSAQFNLPVDWIRSVSGIEERRYASEDETVADMAVAAAAQCLEQAGMNASDIGMFVVASGSSERRFPGPAAVVAHRLGAPGVPALDLPMASAGSLFGMALANSLTAVYGNILVVAAEKMSTVVARQPAEQGVVILFGDGAGACIVGPDDGKGTKILDAALHSDGQFAEDLKLEFDAPLAMNGRAVIMQASRKIPAGIAGLLARNSRSAAEIEIFLMHQANQNLIDRVAKALEVEPTKFYSNIARYGNTSSASMLIAAAEWWREHTPQPGHLICFAGFGAGFH